MRRHNAVTYAAFSLALLYPRVEAADIRYVHTDLTGSVVAISDSGGVVIERREYEPYGRQLAPDTPSGGANFAGHVLDEDTGLIYMQQRYYDPELMRFLSVDPESANTVSGANFNSYWYANNNPFRFIDPDGRAVEEVVGGEIRGQDTTVNLDPVVVRAERKSTDAIVIHRTVSSNASSAIRAAINSGGRTSFHIVIDKDGATTQIANLNNVANHVGKPTTDVSNMNSIGIEVVGDYNSDTKVWDPLTDAQVEATAQAVVVISNSYAIREVAVYPHENVSRKTSGEGSTVLQAIGARLREVRGMSPTPPPSYLIRNPLP